MNKKSTMYLASSASFLICSSVIAGIVDFDNTSDLTTYFNADSTPTYSNAASGGIGNSGVVSISSTSTDVWTQKSGVSLVSGGVYAVSSYFYNNGNAGYGLMGFAIADSNEPYSAAGTPLSVMGMNFHGGGGSFENGSDTTVASTAVTWGGGDLAQGSWFKFTYTLTYNGSNNFDADFLIENSDANGVVSGTRASQSITGEINSTVGGASTLYAYFGNSGSRMSLMDNFESLAAIPEPSVLVLSSIFGAGIFGVRRFFLI